MTDQTPPPPVAPTPSTTPAGWYADPASGRQRWWDGQKWTENFAGALPVTIQRPQSNGIAQAALVLGIIASVLALIPLVNFFTFEIPSLLAIIFGAVGLSNAKKLNGLRHRDALVGLILGLVPIAIIIIYIVIGAIGAAASGGYSTN